MAETAAPAALAAKESGLEAVVKAKAHFCEQRASALGLMKDAEFHKAAELADTDTDTEAAANWRGIVITALGLVGPHSVISSALTDVANAIKAAIGDVRTSVEELTACFRTLKLLRRDGFMDKSRQFGIYTTYAEASLSSVMSSPSGAALACSALRHESTAIAAILRFPTCVDVAAAALDVLLDVVAHDGAPVPRSGGIMAAVVSAMRVAASTNLNAAPEIADLVTRAIRTVQAAWFDEPDLVRAFCAQDGLQVFVDVLHRALQNAASELVRLCMNVLVTNVVPCPKLLAKMTTTQSDALASCVMMVLYGHLSTVDIAKDGFAILSAVFRAKCGLSLSAFTFNDGLAMLILNAHREYHETVDAETAEETMAWRAAVLLYDFTAFDGACAALEALGMHRKLMEDIRSSASLSFSKAPQHTYLYCAVLGRVLARASEAKVADQCAAVEVILALLAIHGGRAPLLARAAVYALRLLCQRRIDSVDAFIAHQGVKIVCNILCLHESASNHAMTSLAADIMLRVAARRKECGAGSASLVACDVKYDF